MLKRLNMLVVGVLASAAALYADELPLANSSQHLHKEFVRNITVDVTLSCDYPTGGNPALVTNIKRWVCAQLGDHEGDFIDMIDEAVNFEADNFMANLEPEEELYDSYDDGMQLDRDLSITRVFENDAFVTFCSSCSGYDGGAHGYSASNWATFRKADGEQMGWRLLDSMTPSEIAEAIERNMMIEYELTDEEDVLQYFCMEPEVLAGGFPLPDTEPFLLESGVTVIYQQYEIGPYAIGMPSCSLMSCDEYLQRCSRNIGLMVDDAEGESLAEEEQMLALLGGKEALMAHLASNIKYPEAAAELGVGGRVDLRIEVKADGSIGRIEVVRSLNPNQEPMAKSMYLWQNKGKTDADYRRYAQEVMDRNLAGEACNAEAARVVRTLPLFKTEGKSYWIKFPVIFTLQ